MGLDFQSLPRGLRHPEILVVPALMQLDHFLTVLAARERRKKLAEHERIADYELNPVFRKSVRELRWFDALHLWMTVVFTAVMCVISEIDPVVLQFFLGAAFGYFGPVIGVHLSNLRIYRYVRLHPEEIAGNLELATTANIAIAQSTMLKVLVPLLLLSVFSRDVYVIGAACGLLRTIWLKHVWYRESESMGGNLLESSHRPGHGPADKPNGAAPAEPGEAQARLDAPSPARGTDAGKSV